MANVEYLHLFDNLGTHHLVSKFHLAKVSILLGHEASLVWADPHTKYS